MATGQTLLNWMEILFPELQLQTGESDVTKGLLALNAAQDMLETHIAQYADLMFGGSVSTVQTTANQEYTTYPSGLLRVDQIDMLGDDSLPSYTLTPSDVGEGGYQWYWNLVNSSSGVGKPASFWTNGTNIYWHPVPNAVYTLRYYGFASASDITASGTYAYPDYTILPVATLATKFIRTGIDDSVDQLQGLATETFNPVLDVMSGFNRTGAAEYRFKYRHDT